MFLSIDTKYSFAGLSFSFASLRLRDSELAPKKLTTTTRGGVSVSPAAPKEHATTRGGALGASATQKMLTTAKEDAARPANG